MPQHPFQRPQGRIDYLQIESQALRGNMLGDPATRIVPVYLPPGYHQSDQRYPLLVGLAGFTGSGFNSVGWNAFRENVPQRIERLVEEGRMGPVVVAFPDCFTALGGNQYINSAAMGQWEDYLCLEMLPALEKSYRLLNDRNHRALFGKSSGGFGSLVQGMLHADQWSALACHAGDMGFDLCYRGEFPGVLRALASHEGSVENFLQQVGSARKVSGGDFELMMNLAMAASYDPDPDSPFGIRLPVDMHSCELIPERWQNWLAWDPVNMVDRGDVQHNLRSLKGLFFDCGQRDQYNLVYGARRLDRKLTTLGIEHSYHEFDDNHSTTDYRMDISLPFLYRQVSA